MSAADRSGLARPHNQQEAQPRSRRPGQHPQRPMAPRSVSEAMPSTADSWIEVSSQASSSSLSSAAGDEIVTTGLRVQQNSHFPQAQRRRRTLASGIPLRLQTANAAATLGEAGSSQDEYEESGSDSDRILAWSNEGSSGPLSQAHSMASRAPPSATSADAEDDSNLEDEDDEDESATALGVRSNQTCFTPQPNAFSHPPSSSREPDSYFSSASTARPQARPRHQSFPTRTGRQTHSPLSSSHHADHDAALRASLSTLLSCAAAARGLPKQHATTAPRQPASSNRVEPGSLRMVPESALRGAVPRPRSRSSSSSLSSSRSPDKKSKRQASSRSNSKERAHLSNKRPRADAAGGDAAVSPTLLTWVVSAGVLVLVSALSFGAGYSAGREAGRIEGSLSPTPTVGGDACSQEAMLRGGTSGLRRLHWSDAASAVTAGA